MKKVKKPLLIAAGITLAVLGLAVSFPNLFQLLSAKWNDVYFRIRGPIPTQNQVVLVTVDEKSISALGRWPWPRTTIASLVEKLTGYGVKAVGFDITFSETSKEDAALASALKKSPATFLGYFFYTTEEEMVHANLTSQEIEENDQTILPSRLNLTSKKLESSGKKVFGAQTNVRQIASSLPSDRQGFFNVFPDDDGMIRRLPLALFYKGSAYPSLSLQLASFAKDFSPIPIFKEEGVLDGLAVADVKVPLNPRGEFFINYRGPAQTFPHISITDVLQGTAAPEALKDKIVLIGATAIGIFDLRVTPMDSNFPGVEVQANVIDNILAGDFLTTGPAWRMASFLLVIGVGLFFGLAIPFFRPLTSFFIFCGVFFGLVLTGYFLFARELILLDNFQPTLNCVLVYSGITIYRFFTEERERRKIKRTFQHYMSPAVIKQLLDNPSLLKLGGERKELTVLFSDIRDFTPKSEKLPPEKVVQLLNDYFNVMTEVVFKYDGTIDKFIGDAIMVIYGAPIFHEDHALRASLTAIEMIQELKKYKEEWCKKYSLDDFQIGIGLNTGPMAVGNMGSEKRLSYTAIGDSVNLASRLESLTKEYKIPIIISDAHYQAVKYHCEAKELGQVQVKGKKEKTLIYELVGKKAEGPAAGAATGESAPTP